MVLFAKGKGRRGADWTHIFRGLGLTGGDRQIHTFVRHRAQNIWMLLSAIRCDIQYKHKRVVGERKTKVQCVQSYISIQHYHK